MFLNSSEEIAKNVAFLERHCPYVRGQCLKTNCMAYKTSEHQEEEHKYEQDGNGHRTMVQTGNVVKCKTRTCEMGLFRNLVVKNEIDPTLEVLEDGQIVKKEK